MSPSIDPPPELAALLRLKRHEQPPAGYVENFLHDFHERQRAEWLRLSPWQWWKDRTTAAWHEWQAWLSPRRLIPAGAAAGLALAGLAWLARPAGEGSQTAGAAKTTETPRGTVTPRDVLPLPEERGVFPGVHLTSDQPAAPAPTPNGLRRTPGDRWVLPSSGADAAVDKATGAPVSQWDERVILVR